MGPPEFWLCNLLMLLLHCRHFRAEFITHSKSASGGGVGQHAGGAGLPGSAVVKRATLYITCRVRKGRRCWVGQVHGCRA